MALFGKTQINPKIIPFIHKGEAVGVVKLEGFGKTSAVLQGDKIIFESYEGRQIPMLKLADIQRLEFQPGNFINEPKMIIGIPNQQLQLKGLDDNDQEFERFYNTLLKLKQQEQKQMQPSVADTPNRMDMSQQIPTSNQPPMMDKTPVQPNNIRSNTPISDEEVDPVDEIRKYFKLKEDGIITDEEFQKKKEQLLGL